MCSVPSTRLASMGQFQVGPLVLRLLHILKDIQTAEDLFNDKVSIAYMYMSVFDVQEEVNIFDYYIITFLLLSCTRGLLFGLCGQTSILSKYAFRSLSAIVCSLQKSVINMYQIRCKKHKGVRAVF